MHINMYSERGIPVIDIVGPIASSEVPVLRESIEEWFVGFEKIIITMKSIDSEEQALIGLLASARTRAGGGAVHCCCDDRCITTAFATEEHQAGAA